MARVIDAVVRAHLGLARIGECDIFIEDAIFGHIEAFTEGTMKSKGRG